MSFAISVLSGLLAGVAITMLYTGSGDPFVGALVVAMLTGAIVRLLLER